MSGAAEAQARTGSLAGLRVEEPFNGIKRQVITTDRLTMSRYAFEPRATFPLHAHPQEQLTLVEQGSVEMTIADGSTTLEEGDWSVVGPEVKHGITAGEEGARILAIVSPARRSRDEYEVVGERASS